MEEFLLKAGPLVESAAYILMVIVVIATIIAKLTPNPKDDKIVSKFSESILMVIRFLPTFGVNPATKKLEKAYAKLEGKENETS